MAAPTYRLKIVQEGREFEAEGDKAFIAEMLELYGPKASASSPGARLAKEKGSGKRASLIRPSTGKSLSIREFIQQLDLKKHTDITLAFGYYLEKHQGVSEFTSADINNCYYEAKLEASNTSQMIIQNIKRGFLMGSKKGEKGRSRYTLTSSGEKFVQSQLPRN
ncbi:MAG: hypothetical protein ACLP3K_04620 [Candidatus Acidiferrales bacterium]